MRKFLLVLAAGFLLAGNAAPARAADANVSIDFFYNALEPQGEWIEAADYGYVWHPNGVGEDWRPYTDGRWVYTDAGWTWDSDEPYGWAVYHYGRWARLENVGWVWVPDTEWGPAWVSWRRSEKHIGWAPLPPEARFQRTVGIQKWADSYYDIGPSNYSFVETRRFGARRLRDVIVEPRQNVTIVTETTNITNITYRDNYVYNDGPQYDVVVRESAEPIQRLRLERRTDVVFDPEGIRSDRYRNRVEGGSFQIIAPTIQIATAAPRRVARSVQQVQINHGWADSGGDQRQVEQLRTKIKAEAKAPAGLPPQPKFDRRAVSASVKEGANSPGGGATPAGVDAASSGKMKAGEQPAAATPPATTAAGEAAPAPAATPAKGKKGSKAAAAATPEAPTATPRNAKNRKGAPPAAPSAPATESADTKPDATMKPATKPEAAASTETPDATAKPASTPATRKRGANGGDKPPGTKKPAADPAGSEPAAPSTPPPAKSKRGAASSEDRPSKASGAPANESAKPARSEPTEPAGAAAERPPSKKNPGAAPSERPGNAPGAAREPGAPGAAGDRSPVRSSGAERPSSPRETAPPSTSGASGPGGPREQSRAAAPGRPTAPPTADSGARGKEKAKGKTPAEPGEPGTPAPGQ